MDGENGKTASLVKTPRELGKEASLPGKFLVGKIL